MNKPGDLVISYSVTERVVTKNFLPSLSTTPAVIELLISPSFDNAKLGGLTILDDAPLAIAETVLIPYYRDELTKIPIPNITPGIVGRLPVMASSDCIPGPDNGCFWRMIPINLVEVDLPIAVLPDFMNDVRRVVQKEVPTALPSIIGFATRFGAKSEGSPLDMAHDADTAYIDIVANKGPGQVDDPSSYQHVFDQIEQLAFCKYQARPHWGKNSNRAFLNPNCPARYKYPKFDEMIQEAKRYDPEGIFISPMLARVINPEVGERTPGCAGRSDCYCDEDWHCGKNHECVPGGTFPEYKVCKFKHLSLRHRLSAQVKDTVLSVLQGMTGTIKKGGGSKANVEALGG